MFKRIFGLIILAIGLFLVGLFLHDILLKGTALRDSMPFRMVIFSLAFIYFGWKWLRGDRLKKRGGDRRRNLPIGLDFVGAVALERVSKILLIDADPEFQNSLEMLCRKKGKQLTVAESGQQGMDFAEQGSFDLFIVSVELPDQRGFSLCNQFKKHFRLKKIPVIMISTEATENTFMLHKRLGVTADAYFTKAAAIRSMNTTV